MKKRVLSILVCMAMVFSMIPTIAQAASSAVSIININSQGKECAATDGDWVGLGVKVVAVQNDMLSVTVVKQSTLDAYAQAAGDNYDYSTGGAVSAGSDLVSYGGTLLNQNGDVQVNEADGVAILPFSGGAGSDELVVWAYDSVSGSTAAVQGTVTLAGGKVTTPFAFTYGTDLPAMKVGVEISEIDVSTGASGGTGSYTFSATGLPAGLSIDEDTGVISGTPTAYVAASANTGITVSAADNGGTPIDDTIGHGGVAKGDQTLTLSPSSISDFYVGQTKEITITSNASGDTVTYNPTVTSGTPATATVGAISNGKFTITAVADGSSIITVSSPATANYEAATSATINLTVSPAGTNTLAFKDGTNTATVEYGDTIDIAALLDAKNSDGTITYTSSDDTNFTVSGGVVTIKNYQNSATITVTQAMGSDGTNPIAGKTLTFTVTAAPRKVTITNNATVSNKVYNGTTTATVGGALDIANKVSGDDVAITGSLTGTFADANVGTGKTVTIGGYALSGAKLDYYTLTGVTAPTKTANITAAKLTGTLAATKTYDTDANVEFGDFTSTSLTGVNSETFTLTGITGGAYSAATVHGSAAFATKPSAVAVTGVSSADPANYDLNDVTGITFNGSITKAAQAALRVTGIPATITYGDSSFTLGTSGGSGTGAVTFSSSDSAVASVVAGTGVVTVHKPGTVTFSATKATDTNYTVISSTGDAAKTVAKKELTITPLSFNKKISEGAGGIELSTALTVNGLVTSGQSAGALSYGAITDNVESKGTTGASIASSKLTWSAEGKATFPVTMAASDYYTLAATTITLIVTSKTPQTITVDHKSAENVTYGDAFRVTATGGTGTGAVTYTSSNTTVATVVAGTGVVTILKPGSFTITATKAEDATYAQATDTTGTITVQPKKLTLNTTAEKDYDGTVSIAIVDLADTTLTGFVTGDTGITLTGITAATADANAASGKAVTVTAITLTGDTNGKYDTTGLLGTVTATINPAKLNVTTGTVSKTYDGTTAKGAATATVSLAATGAQNGEVIVITGFDGAFNVSGVTAASFVLSSITFTVDGADTGVGNYELTDSAVNKTVTGAITRAPLTAAKGPSKDLTDTTAVKLTDVAAIGGVVNNEDANTILATGWAYDAATGTYKNTAGTVKAVFYEKTATDTYVLVTTALALDKTYYVDVTLPAGDYGNYNLGTGLTAQGHAPSSDADAANFVTLNLKNSPPPPSGGGGVSSYTVTYDEGEHGTLAEGAAKTEKVNHNKAPNAPAIVAAAGYKFMGWSVDGKTVLDMTKEKVTKAVTYKAVYAAYDHKPYMVGIGEGVFAPTGTLTRAEAATMLARLTPGFAEGTAYANDFIDAQDGWYTSYIGFAAANGIAFGVGDGLFQPMRTITRGEFAAMLARFMGLEPATDLSACPFSDCAGHWTEGYILALHQAGVLDGLADGTVQPDRSITREEAAKMVNVAIGRTPSKTQMDKTISEYTNPYGDVSVDLWSFYHIMEASVKHVSNDFHGEN